MLAAIEPNDSLGIYKRMMLRALRQSIEDGFEKAIAAVEVDFHLRAYLHKLGFKDIGGVTLFDDLPRQGTVCQPMVCDLGEAQVRWAEIQKSDEEELKEKLKEKFVTIVDE
jgi:hypothetical protein